jgi:hypothetical protein
VISIPLVVVFLSSYHHGSGSCRDFHPRSNRGARATVGVGACNPGNYFGSHIGNEKFAATVFCVCGCRQVGQLDRARWETLA